MLDNPLLILPEPSSVFAVLISESDTSPAVVNLLAAETLIARHKGRTGQLATGTVGRAGVVVVGHVLKPQKLKYAHRPTLSLRAESIATTCRAVGFFRWRGLR